MCTLASQLLEQSKQKEPPVDLDACYSYRRIIKEVVDYSLKRDAWLRVLRDGFEIVYRPSDRDRFSKAHELGHTYFYRLDTAVIQRLAHPPVARLYEEEACDAFATELLMPEEWVRNKFDTFRGESPATLVVKLARLFKVTYESMARRLVRDLNLLDSILLGVTWSKKTDNQNLVGEFAWRAFWGYAPLKFDGKLYLPPFGKLPRMHLKCLEDSFISFLSGKPSTGQPFYESVGHLKIGNLAQVLRADYHLEQFPIYISWRPRQIRFPSSNRIDDNSQREHVLAILSITLS
jgi:hypothetical protein